MNYNRTKAKHVCETARVLVRDFEGKVPETIEELVTLPGVGRKTANLVVSECFGKPGICVDTHVHRIANVFGIVDTTSPEKTEFALREVAPEQYWSRINRLFVLWGQEVPGREKERLEAVLD
jgi:endonuclease III